MLILLAFVHTLCLWPTFVSARSYEVSSLLSRESNLQQALPKLRDKRFSFEDSSRNDCSFETTTECINDGEAFEVALQDPMQNEIVLCPGFTHSPTNQVVMQVADGNLKKVICKGKKGSCTIDGSIYEDTAAAFSLDFGSTDDESYSFCGIQFQDFEVRQWT